MWTDSLEKSVKVKFASQNYCSLIRFVVYDCVEYRQPISCWLCCHCWRRGSRLPSAIAYSAGAFGCSDLGSQTVKEGKGYCSCRLVWYRCTLSIALSISVDIHVKNQLHHQNSDVINMLPKCSGNCQHIC